MRCAPYTPRSAFRHRFRPSVKRRSLVESIVYSVAVCCHDGRLEDKSGDEMDERFESVGAALDFAIGNEVEALRSIWSWRLVRTWRL